MGAFQVSPAFQSAFQQGAAMLQNVGVVLFPVEPLIFRSRWDKTMYSWTVYMRDLRAPTWEQGKDHLVSAIALAA